MRTYSKIVKSGVKLVNELKAYADAKSQKVEELNDQIEFENTEMLLAENAHAKLSEIFTPTIGAPKDGGDEGHTVG